ncbi:MAG: LysR family transcriptional regulator [Oscillospiraceae bacterium]|nr:LysR family transcriptional regulator [Oscillospiraceae bacterium]
MTTRHLRIFSAVYQSGSMTAAAKQLYMTQPSVSQAIRELENHYQVRLFERMHHRLYPTPSGEQLFQYARQVLGIFEEMESSMQSAQQTQALELGLFFTAGMLVHPWLKKFRCVHPNTEVHVRCYKGSELKRLLRSNLLDLAIMEESTGDEDLIQEIFAEDRLIAVTATDDPLLEKDSITVEELGRLPLLLREQGAGVRDQFQRHMNDLGIQLKFHWESASSLVLLDACRHREGVAILPYELARGALERGEVAELPVTGIDFRRRMALTWHRDKYITSAMEDFMNIVRNSAVPCSEP